MKTFIKDGKTYANRADLLPWDENPRDIKPDRLAELVDSIKQYGQFKPIITTITGLVIGGNMRMRGYEQLGIDEVWVSVVDTDNPREAFKLAVRDKERYGYYLEDQLANLAEKYELTELEMGDLYLDVGEVQTLEQIVEKVNGKKDTNEDEPPEAPETAESSAGKVYALGDHRIMCGDATSAGDMKVLMGGGAMADLYLTDPPYNVEYNQDSVANLKARRRRQDTLKLKNDKFDTPEKFRQFLVNAYRTVDVFMKKGASFYIFHADAEGINFRQAVVEAGWQLRQCLIWNKNVFVMGRQDYHWKHEPILYGWKSGSSHSWYSDRTQTTVLNFDRPKASKEHPTMKPIAILAYLIENNSKAGDIILDNFLGSGSTLIAAHQTGRVCYGLELDPRYVDVIRQRYANLIEAKDWQAATPEVS